MEEEVVNKGGDQEAGKLSSRKMGKNLVHAIVDPIEKKKLFDGWLIKPRPDEKGIKTGALMVVAIVVETCDRLVTRDREVRLSDILAYVDARWRVIPSCEEVKAALRQRPSLGIVRRETGIVVVRGAKEHVVEPEDRQHAYREYEIRFQARFVKGDGPAHR